MKAVFVWRAEAGKEEEFERRWELGSRIVQKHEGAQGTRLHRSVTDPRIFLGYASWTTFEDRERMEEELAAEYEQQPWDRSRDISELLFAGFFDDPHMEVQPET
jgi:hypothetical protein